MPRSNLFLAALPILMIFCSRAEDRIAFEDFTAKVMEQPKGKGKDAKDIPQNWDIAWLDANGDGRPDIVLVSGTPGKLMSTLWLAKGDGTFVVQPPEMLPQLGGLCVTPLDLKGGGRDSLFVVGQDDVGDYLLTNESSGEKIAFTVAKLRGGSANHYAALGDIDGDGKLEYVITPGGTTRILDMATDKSIREDTKGVGGPVYVADFENDDFPEIFVLGQRNHTHVYPEGEREAFFVNHKGELKDQIAESSLGKSMARHGVAACADFNNAGRLDILICGYLAAQADPKKKVSLFKNNGDGTFTDVTEQSGLPVTGTGAAWRDNISAADFDNDGFCDLLVVGQVWRNTGNFHFEKGPHLPVKSPPYSHRHDVADYDGDGKCDILAQSGASEGVYLSVFRNTSANTNHWLGVTLKGAEGNPGAVGARVTVYQAGTQTIAGFQQVLRDNSHAMSRLHFGLGAQTKVDVCVHFPHGGEYLLKEVAADRRMVVDAQGKLSPEAAKP